MIKIKKYIYIFIGVILKSNVENFILLYKHELLDFIVSSHEKFRKDN